ncbi:MAG: glycosyltransferase [Limisphaerales bacterium]
MLRELPKISIIVPVYNSAKSVEASLQSLFNQTLHDIEIIAVNDASTDDSGNVLKKLAKQEARLKVIDSLTNVGVHHARAAGIRAANAPWIGFLDADDFAKPTMFERLYQTASMHEPDICICGSELLTAEHEKLGDKVCFPADGIIVTDIFESFCELRFGSGALWNKLYRAELMKRWGVVQFRWRQDATEDTLVNIGCFLDARKVCLLKEVLHEYVRHSSSANAVVSKAKALVRLLRAYAVAIEIYGRGREDAAAWITGLYGKQLAYDDYHVSSAKQLEPFHAELIEAFSLVAHLYPEGLALLIQKKLAPVQNKSFRAAFYDFVRLAVRLPLLFTTALIRRMR